VAARARQGSCRIIGGRWRSRIIRFNDAEGLRPTTDRIRETVFNWLQPYLYQSHCLDCFAGSGILGFEALSRGAADVLFIEHNRKTVDSLQANVRLLAADGANVLHADTLEWMTGVQHSSYFDLVFLDPPFHSDLLAKSCVLLDSSGCLADNAIIYVEHGVNTNPVLPEKWVCLKQKTSGQVSYELYATSNRQ
jgi:16S rRNA (guanine966-N2)-methyltransferase